MLHLPGRDLPGDPGRRLFSLVCCCWHRSAGPRGAASSLANGSCQESCIPTEPKPHLSMLLPVAQDPPGMLTKPPQGPVVPHTEALCPGSARRVGHFGGSRPPLSPANRVAREMAAPSRAAPSGLPPGQGSPPPSCLAPPPALCSPSLTTGAPTSRVCKPNVRPGMGRSDSKAAFSEQHSKDGEQSCWTLGRPGASLLGPDPVPCGAMPGPPWLSQQTKHPETNERGAPRHGRRDAQQGATVQE